MQKTELLIFRSNDITLGYRKHGNGTNTLIMFHGFGQDHSAFDPLSSKLSHEFNTISIDLFYHGASTRPDALMDKKEWKKIFQSFLKHEAIGRFSLAGFSLGGRFAICTAVLFESIVERIYLIAPDGIYESPWYKIATTFPGKWLFYWMVKSPTRFNTVISIIERGNFINPSLLKFTKNELRDPENLKRVYRSWVYFKPLKIKKSVIQKFFASKNETFLIIGIRDNIIPNSISKYFRPDQVNVLDARHHELINADQTTALFLK